MSTSSESDGLNHIGVRTDKLSFNGQVAAFEKCQLENIRKYFTILFAYKPAWALALS